jgi:hypothetical protein
MAWHGDCDCLAPTGLPAANGTAAYAPTGMRHFRRTLKETCMKRTIPSLAALLLTLGSGADRKSVV